MALILLLEASHIGEAIAQDNIDIESHLDRAEEIISGGDK